jgi:putative ABC transport system permease protein
VLTDFRQALRVLVQSPGVSTLIVVVLALGIGANTAIFSIVYGIILKPLPFADPSRLVSVRSTLRTGEGDSAAVPDVVDWRAQSTTLAGIAPYTGNDVAMTGRGDAVTLHVALTTSDLFTVLGVKPVLGRPLAPSDDAKGADAVAVISESTWEHRFGRSGSIVGESATLDGRRFTIVGVMPSGFRFPIQADPIDAWLPLGSSPLLGQFLEQRGAHFVQVVGRLAPGAGLAAANAELTTIAARLAAAYPKTNTNRGASVRPLHAELVKEYRAGLLVLMCAVTAVLLIACANVANLLLARASTRQKEMAIRVALGATRAHLLRQLLAESVVLSILGGVLGAVLAMWSVEALVAANPLQIPRLQNVTVDRGLLLFTMAVSTATGVLFGLVPALQLSRSDGGETLREAGRGSSGGRSARTRQLLVIGEVATSLVLLASAGLLLRSLLALQHVDPGFVAEHAVTTELSLPKARYPDPPAQIAFAHRLVDQMRTVPGVSSSAVATTLPMSGSNLGLSFTIDGRPQDPATRPSAAYFSVSPDYFAAMGIRLVKGRAFTSRDDATSPNVAVISEALARRYWPGDDPIGKHLTIGYNNTGPREIVGIVADVKNLALAETMQPALYTPFAQAAWPFLSAVVRTSGDPGAVAGSLRAAIVKLDPDQPVGKVQTVTEYLARSVATPRFTATVVGAFAAVALLLAGFGLFSVMAYSVAQRRREIGIRVALGARAGDVRWMVVGQALRLGSIGLGLGLIGAFGASRVLDSLLFGVSANDPFTFTGVCAMLLLVLTAAAYLPARRATRVDPIVALRTE